MIYFLVSVFSIFAADIEVQPLSYVNSDKVSLYHIVQIDKVSKEDENILKSVELASDLSPQTYRSFSRSFMVDLIKKLNLSSQTKIKIPEMAFIVRDTKKWNKENVNSSLLEEMKSQCNECEIKIKLERINDVKNVISWEFKINPQVRNQKLYIPTKINTVENNQIKTVTTQIVADIFYYQEIPVVKANMNRGVRLSEQDIVMKRILLPTNGRFYSRLSDVLDRKTNRILRSGQAIQFDDLEKNLDVRRGELVKATVKSSNIEINLQVKASENGSVGDIIRVENPLTKKQMHATVTRISEVEIK